MSLENWGEIIQSVLDQSQSFGIFVANTSGELLYMNTAAKRFTHGNPVESMLNPNFSTLIERTQSGPFKGIFTFGSYSSQNNSFNCEAFRREDEILVVGEIDVKQLMAQNIAMTRMNQEISNLQRNLIKEKKLLNATLEKMKQLNEEKNRFLGIAAHDLRNPIGSAAVLSQLILENFDQTTSAELTKYVTQINSSCEFALRLLNDLLDINKIESGKLELVLQRENYAEFVCQVVDYNQFLAHSKQIELTCSACCINLEFAFDRVRLTEVLNNLISNAIKHSQPRTKVSISIEVEGNLVRTSVSDQGPGIKPEDVSKLFQPFSTTSNKTTQNEKSVGLGLAIVQKIISTHQGKIEVESTYGKGSRFFFSIPKNLEPQTISSAVI